MNILLHTCCAPCGIFPAEEARKDGHKVAGFFYNPNIHPYPEYLRRRDEVEKYSKEAGIEVIYPDYGASDYFESVSYGEVAKNRCPTCWRLRMEKTARFAAGNGFEAFTTTLLGSPYQDHAVIKNLCEDVANRARVKFYYKDFRTGFRDAHREAKARGMYCQNYCGCLFSERERIARRNAKVSSLSS